MFRYRMMLNALAFTIVSLALASVAQAQAPQTFVSAQRGDDANPCSLREPCRSIEQALSQVQASGEVIIVDSGDYQPFKISQAVTVQAAPGIFAGIAATSGSAVGIDAGSADAVVLRGLTLNGLGADEGITFTAGAALHVESCVVNGFAVRGINFLVAASSQLFVKDTIVRNCGFHGVRVTTTSGTVMASISHSRFEKNGIGVGGLNNVKVTIRDSVAAGNNDGFGLIPSIAGVTSHMDVESCVVTGNNDGVKSGFSSGTAIIRVSNSTVTNNNFGLRSSANSSILTRGNNTVEANTANGSFTGTFAAK